MNDEELEKYNETIARDFSLFHRRACELSDLIIRGDDISLREAAYLSGKMQSSFMEKFVSYANRSCLSIKGLFENED